MLILVLAFIAISSCSLPPQTPIIGIYTQSIDGTQPTLQDSFKTYIPASYIKFIEMQGAQVVPIFAYSSQAYLQDLLPKLNGVLFPGGGQTFDIQKRWTSNADYIVKYSMAQKKQGKIFPIWGTCLGLQLLGYLTANYDQNVITPVRGETAIINKLQPTAEASYLLSNLPDNVYLRATKGSGITYFNHHYAITLATFRKNPLLSAFWKVTSTTTSPYNQEFVSIMESRQYPIYAIQFHPQKNLFEWKVYADRSIQGAELTQILGNKFIEMARQSENSFPTVEEFYKLSIYNYQVTPSNTTTGNYVFQESTENYQAPKYLQTQ